MGFIFAQGKFPQRRQYRYNHENYPQSKMSTFTVILRCPFVFSVFQHYRLYDFMFSHTQAEEIIGTDVSYIFPCFQSLYIHKAAKKSGKIQFFKVYIDLLSG